MKRLICVFALFSFFSATSFSQEDTTTENIVQTIHKDSLDIEKFELYKVREILTEAKNRSHDDSIRITEWDYQEFLLANLLAPDTSASSARIIPLKELSAFSGIAFNNDWNEFGESFFFKMTSTSSEIVGEEGEERLKVSGEGNMNGETIQLTSEFWLKDENIVTGHITLEGDKGFEFHREFARINWPELPLTWSGYIPAVEADFATNIILTGFRRFPVKQ